MSHGRSYQTSTSAYLSLLTKVANTSGGQNSVSFANSPSMVTQTFVHNKRKPYTIQPFPLTLAAHIVPDLF